MSRGRSSLQLPDGRFLHLLVDKGGSVYISEFQAELLRGMRRALRMRQASEKIRQHVRAAVIRQSLNEHKEAGHPKNQARLPRVLVGGWETPPPLPARPTHAPRGPDVH